MFFAHLNIKFNHKNPDRIPTTQIMTNAPIIFPAKSFPESLLPNRREEEEEELLSPSLLANAINKMNHINTAITHTTKNGTNKC